MVLYKVEASAKQQQLQKQQLLLQWAILSRRGSGGRGNDKDGNSERTVSRTVNSRSEKDGKHEKQ